MDLLIINKNGVTDSAYKDGDILLAFGNLKILRQNARDIFDKIQAKPDIVSGYIQDDFTEAYFDCTMGYKYIRLNENEVKKIDLKDDSEEVLSGVRNYQGNYVIIENEIKSSSHLFGSYGKEIWYREKNVAFNPHKVWQVIEKYSDYRKQDYLNWPLTDTEKRFFLSVTCKNIKDGLTIDCPPWVAAEKVQPIYKEQTINPIINQKKRVLARRRRWFLPYWDFDSLETDTIRNMDRFSDFRDLPDNSFSFRDVEEDCYCKIKEGLYLPEGV